MIAQFLNFLSDSVFDLLGTLLGVLAPASALNYQSQIYALMDNELVSTVLSWVNYFLPLGMASTVITAWGVVMIGYIAFKLVMSYGKMTL